MLSLRPFLLFVFLLYSHSSYATPISNLHHQINSSTQEADISYHFIDNKTNKTLAAHNSKKQLIPSSLIKLFVSAPSLHYLGENYRFKTSIIAKGDLDSSGLLKGRLILKGYGDPSLSYKDLQTLVKKCKQQGIQKVDGSIEVDNSYFLKDYAPSHLEDDDIMEPLASGSGALILDKNLFLMSILPPKKPNENQPRIILKQHAPYIKVINKAVFSKANGKTTLATKKLPQKLSLEVSGTMFKNTPPAHRRFSFPGPSSYVQAVFREVFETETQKPQSLIKAASLNHEVANHLSAPLSKILYMVNKDSNNAATDMILHSVAKKISPSTNDLNSIGISSCVKYYEQLTQKQAEFIFHNGSGLSRESHASSYEFTLLLHNLQKQSFFNSFRNSLALAGEDGMLISRFKATPLEKKLYGKTGTSRGNQSLAGYFTSKSKKDIAFCVIINKFKGSRQDLKNVVDTIILNAYHNL